MSIRKRRSNQRIKPLKFNISLKGEKGKPLRIICYIVVALVIFVLATNLFRPKVQLQNTAEYRRINELGYLTVGILEDMPGFSDAGSGLEVELATRFAQYLLPDSDYNSSVKLVTVSDTSASTKLSDGSVDVVIALMQKNASSRFNYSYTYYTDSCVVAINKDDAEKPLNEMVIGYVQSSASYNVLKNYISEHETVIEESIIDKLLGKEKELPTDAITFTTQAFASYPDMLIALENGRIDGAAISQVYLDNYDTDSRFKPHSTVLNEIEYTFAFSSDNSVIAQLADMFIYDLRESGELDAMLLKYGLK